MDLNADKLMCLHLDVQGGRIVLVGWACAFWDDVRLHAAHERYVGLRSDWGCECVPCACVLPAALNLPPWLNLSTARSMLLQRLMGHVAVASLDADEADKMRRQVRPRLACSSSSFVGNNPLEWVQHT